MPARDAVIVDAVRTPVGKKNGSLAGWHAADLSAHVLRALVEPTGIDPAVVDDVVWGCVQQVGQQSYNVGRMGVLAAGWPESVPAVTIDRQCGSSQQSVHFAAAGLLSGQYDVAVAGGVEIMSAVPLGASYSSGEFGLPAGPLVAQRYDGAHFNQGTGAEMMAEKWGFSRAQLDEFALGRVGEDFGLDVELAADFVRLRLGRLEDRDQDAEEDDGDNRGDDRGDRGGAVSAHRPERLLDEEDDAAHQRSDS